MRWVFVSIGVIVLVCLGGLFLYDMAHSRGEADGYSDGYNQGYTYGQQVGYSSGKSDGYQLGKREGYGEGYLAGKTDGYEGGVEDGYKEGLEVGYEEGVGAVLDQGYAIIDPTYKQAIKFLNEDETNRNTFVDDTYVCSHFARDVCNNAEEVGIRCAFVEIRHSERGHSIIAFATSDKGLVYFEPQSDEKVRPIVGKQYYQCVEPKPGYYYEEPLYDDTILDILVVW